MGLFEYVIVLSRSSSDWPWRTWCRAWRAWIWWVHLTCPAVRRGLSQPAWAGAGRRRGPGPEIRFPACYGSTTP